MRHLNGAGRQVFPHSPTLCRMMLTQRITPNIMKIFLICLVLAQNVNTNSNEQNRAKQQPQSSPVQTALPSLTSVGNSNVRGSGNAASGGSDKKTDNNSDATSGKTSSDEWAFWVMLSIPPTQKPFRIAKRADHARLRSDSVNEWPMTRSPAEETREEKESRMTL